MVSDKTIVEREDGLVIVTLNRPHKKNALNALELERPRRGVRGG